MAINKKLIHFKTLANFNNQLNAGNILETSICFIQDANLIWTHGTFYDGSQPAADSIIIKSFQIAAGTNADLEILETDTVSEAFGKIQKQINDDSLVVAAALKELRDEVFPASKIAEIYATKSELSKAQLLNDYAESTESNEALELKQTDNIVTAISKLQKQITDNERVTSESLSDLNDRKPERDDVLEVSIFSQSLGFEPGDAKRIWIDPTCDPTVKSAHETVNITVTAADLTNIDVIVQYNSTNRKLKYNDALKVTIPRGVTYKIKAVDSVSGTESTEQSFESKFGVTRDVNLSIA